MEIPHGQYWGLGIIYYEIKLVCKEWSAPGGEG